MCSSRTDKSVSHFGHVCLCECLQKQTMWHGHVCSVVNMQRAGPYRLDVSLQDAHGVAK
jgi:hypothetical protein